MANNVDMGQINWTVKATAQEASEQVKKLSNNINGLSKVLKLVNFTAFIAACKRIGQTIFSAVNQTSQYIQKMNQFKSIMGESASTAQEFIDKAERILGLDPEQMMGSLSSFQTLTKGFGIASNEAYKMSKNLTQLAADMSSFTGESMDLALQRLRSGISGEIEPMRKWGIALDQATLQETAYALGINKRVAEMTRAQKTELAYYQIMHATQYAQGNMARTMLTPASAIRILQTEFKQLGRAIGSVFIPIAMKIIPVIRAITQVLTDLAKRLAALFGFKIEDYDFSAGAVQDISAAFGDMEDNVNGTTKALKKMLMPFDELNNVNFDTGSGSGGIGGIGGGSLGLDTYDYDMFAGASDKMNEKVQEIKKTLETLKPIILAIGGALAAMWAVDKIMTFVDWIDKVIKHSSELKTALEIGLVIAGAYLLYNGIKHAIDTKTMDAESILKILAGGTLIASAGALKFKKPAVLKIGILATFDIVLVTSMASWWNEYFEEEKQKIYGDKKELNFGQTIYTGLSAIGMGFNEHVIEKIFGEDALQPVIDWVAKVIKKFDEIKDTVKDWWSKKVSPWFTKEKWKEVAEKAINAVKEKFTNWKDNFKPVEDWWNDKVAPWFTKEKWKEVAENAVKGIKEKFTDWKDNFKPIEDWWNDKIAPWFTVEKWKNVADNAKKGIETKFTEWRQGFHPIRDWWNDKIAPWFTVEKWRNVTDNAKRGIETKFTEWKQNFHPIRDWWNDKVAPWFSWNTWRNLGVDAVNGLRNAFSNFSIKFKLPHFTWTTKKATGWVADILSALSLPTSLPKLNVSWYAEGGFPNTGDLFFANEAGPELVGNIGRRTAVANQQQITEGISEATYNAFSRALNENRGNNETNPYWVIKLEDDTIYKGQARKENQYSNMYGVKL